MITTKLTRQKALRQMEKAEKLANSDHYWWTRCYWVNREGKPLDFRTHAYLRSIYKDRSRHISIQKASQTGISEWLISLGFFVTDKMNKNVGYFMPTSTQVADHVQTRVDPVIEKSWYVSSITKREGDIGGGKAPDKMGLKRVGDAFLYFRGGQNANQLTSIQLDCALVDELDRFEEVGLAMIEKRMNHSSLKWVRNGTTPTIQGRGINAEMEGTTEMAWWVECPKCMKKQVLDFFKNVDQAKKLICCWSCNTHLDVACIQRGVWLPKNPNASRQGYYVTGMLSPYFDVGQVVDNLNSYNETKIQEAYNQDLGLPYSSGGNLLTDNDLDSCQRDYALPYKAEKMERVYAGLDIGKKSNLITMMDSPVTGQPRLIGAFELMDVEKEVDRFMREFRIVFMVVDGNPETALAAKLVERYPGRIFLNYYMYKDTVGGKYILWYDNSVQSHRTATLDEMYGMIRSQLIELPQNARYIPGLYDQLKNQRRVAGIIRSREIYIYEDGGRPDHYGHAMNYALIARDHLPGALNYNEQDQREVHHERDSDLTVDRDNTIFGGIMNKEL